MNARTRARLAAASAVLGIALLAYGWSRGYLSAPEAASPTGDARQAQPSNSGDGAGRSEGVAVVTSPHAAEARPNIVFVVFDATRVDRLAPWDGPAARGAVAKLAREGVVFEHAYSASSWTSSASASFFTSTYPSQHQVLTGYAMVRRAKKRRGETMRPNRIPAELETLPEALKAAGYRTFGVSDNLNICPPMGFDRGFDRFVHYDYRGAEAVNAATSSMREGLRSEEAPYFLYVHYMDPHQPYHRREAYYDEERSGGARFAAYDSELDYADAHLEALLEALNVDDDTLVILLADHGEEFGDHGRTGHRNQLYTELIHVPLIVRWPSHFAPQRVRENVSTIDLLPTLRALVGAEASTQDRGVDLSPALRGDALNSQRPLFAMRVNELRPQPLWRRAVIQAQHEYIWSMPRDRRELYDVEADPAEMHDLARHDEARVRAIHELLTRELESATVYPRAFARERELDPELEERLRALGYAN